MDKELMPVEVIENKIYIIRSHKVMLDKDLAGLYGVPTKRLNEQVRRNIDRFPEDFMLQLTKEEQEILRSQIATSSYGGRRYLPTAFTEHGILMLSSVLNSRRAIHVNIQIMRTFTKLRRMFTGYKELKERIDKLENNYDSRFKVVFDAINEMLTEPATKVKGVGFKKEK